MKNILCGFMIGVFKIIPGVSGSLLAIFLGVYEKSLLILTDITKIRVHDFFFLLTLFIGVLLGISVFSYSVKWLLHFFYFPTMLLFCGMIVGGIFRFVRSGQFIDTNIRIRDINWLTLFKRQNFSLILSFVLCFILIIVFSRGGFIKLGSFNSNGVLNYFFFGVIEAISSLIPGISGTAIYISLGCYEVVLDFWKNVFLITYFKFLFFFGVGGLITAIILAKAITYLFDKYRRVTNCGILGFSVGSLVCMFFKLDINYGFFDIFLGILFFIGGFVFAFVFNLFLSRK